MDEIERTLGVAMDRDALHRLVDQLTDDAIAVVMVKDAKGLTRRVYGNAEFSVVLGIIEAEKSYLVAEWMRDTDLGTRRADD